MRLLEFDTVISGENLRCPGQVAKKRKSPAKIPEFLIKSGKNNFSDLGLTDQGQPVRLPPRSIPLMQAAARNPVDLEQLQDRMDFIERRLQQQTRQAGKFARARELERLKLRMQVLERSLDHELAAAREREHRLLAALDTVSLKIRLRQRLMRLWLHDLPVTAHWLERFARAWWLDSQPEWWPRFTRAWRESLEQARR
jgi:hypothetical protein